MRSRGRHRQSEAGAVIVGSGGGGLISALAARKGLGRVVVVEASKWIGGTTAVSGGVIWVPCNEHMKAAGLADDREQALQYLQAVSGDSVKPGVLEAFVASSPRMLRFLEDNTTLEFDALLRTPDYRQEISGARTGGRGLEVRPIDGGILGSWASRVRLSPHYPSLTLSEMKGSVYDPRTVPWDRAAERMQNGVRTLGSALICGLLAACLDAGVEVLAETRARDLIIENGRVAGIECTDPDGHRLALRSQNVILATGGFEWNDSMLDSLGGIGGIKRASSPTGFGDGIRMALRAGAALGHLGEGWWELANSVPGESWLDGEDLYRLNIAERTLPGSILVNRLGRRFANEAMNYHDLGRLMLEVDPATGLKTNDPAWMIYDERFRSKYLVLTAMPDLPAPSWMVSAPSIGELAEAIGVDRRELESTVERFNEFARVGRDLDFSRGENPYDLYQADPRHQPNPSLGVIDEPPYYAIESFAALVGTKGGLLIDEHASVLGFDDDAIPGLFACGNLVAGSTTGRGLAGPGGTIGPALTFGYIAGTTVAQRERVSAR